MPMGVSTDTCMGQLMCKTCFSCHSCVNPVSPKGFYRQVTEQKNKVSVRGTELAVPGVDPGSLALTLICVLTPTRL